ncbi:hypothetical protein BH24ACT7_BH24ACT7_21300 [soil metagenome]
MSTTPQVRDYTDHSRRLPLHVEASPVFEFLLGLFTYQARDEDPDMAAQVDSTFFEHVDAHISDEVRGILTRLTGCGELWLTLIGVAYTAPKPHTLEGFFDHVAGYDPVELRKRLLNNAGVTAWRGFDPAVIDAAAAGDHEAIEQVMTGQGAALSWVFRLDPVETRDDLVSLMRRIHHEVPFDEEGVMPALRRDAAATRAMAEGTPTGEVVETVTRGITFAMQPGMTGVVLIPSLVIRPWVMISEHDGLRFFAYPVAEEHLNLDPAAPPSSLVDTVKALGDERRLRILYLLNEGPLTLAELVEKLDLAKSTAHHHLRTLRTAGLTRVIVGGDDEKRHEVRGNALADLGLALQRYVNGSPSDDPTDR